MKWMRIKNREADAGRADGAPSVVGLASALRRAFLGIPMAVLVLASGALPAGRAAYRGAAQLGLVSAAGMPRDLRSVYVAYVVWSACALGVWVLTAIWLAREAGSLPQKRDWRLWWKWLSRVGLIVVALAICFAWAPPEPAFGPVAVLARPGWGLYAWVNAAVVGIELVLGWLAVGLLIFSRRGRRTAGGVAVGLLGGLAWWACLGAPWFAAADWMNFGPRIYLCLPGPLAWASYGPMWMKLWLWSCPLLVWGTGLVALTEYCRRTWPVARAVDAARVLADVVAVVPAVVVAGCFPFGGRWVFGAREVAWNGAMRPPMVLGSPPGQGLAGLHQTHFVGGPNTNLETDDARIKHEHLVMVPKRRIKKDILAVIAAPGSVAGCHRG